MRTLGLVAICSLLAFPALAQRETCADKAKRTATLVAHLNADATNATDADALVLGDQGLARLSRSLTHDIVVNGNGDIFFWGRRVKDASLTTTMQQTIDKEQKLLDRIRGVGGTGPALPTVRPLVIAVHGFEGFLTNRVLCQPCRLRRRLESHQPERNP